MFGRRSHHPTCFVCGSRIGPNDERMSVRGGTEVHRRCATYRMRHRATVSRSSPTVRIQRSDD